MKRFFPLFQSHLDLAHTFWSQIVQIGDLVIDATSGNGHDTLKLCQLALSNDKGKIYAIDIQKEAIDSTFQYLSSHLLAYQMERVILQQCCHSSFPYEILEGSVKLIVYNLGYLPGGNKSKTTQISTTLMSLAKAIDLLQPGGVVSVTCYPGHPEGAEEQQEILAFVKTLPPQIWSCSQHKWLNRKNAPSLLLLQKTLN